METRVCAAERCSVSLQGRHPNCRYCSTRCKRGRRAPSAACEWCGGPVVSNHGNARYCSVSCRVRKSHAAVPPEENRRRAREWRQANPERYRAAHAKRTAERRAALAKVFVQDVDRREVWDRDGGICHICQNPADPSAWHLDHVVPLSKGGEHSYANVAVSHPLCNLRKGARLVA